MMGVSMDIRILHLWRTEMKTGIRVHRWSMDSSSGEKLKGSRACRLCGVRSVPLPKLRARAVVSSGQRPGAC